MRKSTSRIAALAMATVICAGSAIADTITIPENRPAERNASRPRSPAPPGVRSTSKPALPSARSRPSH